MRIQKYLETRAQLSLWSIEPRATLLEFATELHRRGVGALTVIGDDGFLAGIISERDLVGALALNGSTFEQLTVADTMTREVITCSPEDDMLETLEMMNTHHIRHIPVVKADTPLTMIGIREFDFACGELRELASADALTGLSLEDAFLSSLNKEVERHRRSKEPLSIAILSLEVPVTTGSENEAGLNDETLTWFAKLLTKHFRAYDGIGRLGEEVFGIVFPNSDISEAEAAAQRLKRLVQHGAGLPPGQRLKLKQGVTSVSGYQVPGREILSVARELLSEAKHDDRYSIVAKPYLVVTNNGVSYCA